MRIKIDGIEIGRRLQGHIQYTRVNQIQIGIYVFIEFMGVVEENVSTSYFFT